MLTLVDVLIRDLLINGVGVLTSDAQVRFQPPDGTLRIDVVNLNQMALCLYLADLRENRKLRSNERSRTLDNGYVFTERAPDRIDCHYLISAWSPTQPAPGVEPTLEEHQLLYDTAATLILGAPLNPSRLYPPLSLKLMAWPTRFQQEDLPTHVLPADGFGKLSEFWTTMGPNMPWRPVVQLVVTIPVALVRELAGPMVTTKITEYRVSGVPGTAETWIQIGGHVLDTNVPAGQLPQPISGAWVLLENLAGSVLRRAETNVLGRFSFDWLRAGQYQLHTGAVGFGEQTRLVDVPSETGEYDLSFP